MATDLAPVSPSVLEWARRSVGVSLEEAATRAGVKPERIAEWEAGTAKPTVAKLRSLGKLYMQPLAVFFLPEPPEVGEPLRDFRKLPGDAESTWSRALHKVYLRALQQRETAAELVSQGGELPPFNVPALKLSDPTERTGEEARAALGVTLAVQHSWPSPRAAFNGWLAAVESLGVMVLSSSDVPMETMRGFSLSGSGIPVIVVNALDALRGQVFTLAHEFAHLMLREGGLCDFSERDGGTSQQIESWCNRAAGSLLMPHASLLENEVVNPPESVTGRRKSLTNSQSATVSAKKPCSCVWWPWVELVATSTLVADRCICAHTLSIAKKRGSAVETTGAGPLLTEWRSVTWESPMCGLQLTPITKKRSRCRRC